MTTYLYGERGSKHAVAIQWKATEDAGVAIDQAIVRRLPYAAETSLDDALRPGDTLVVRELGCLGENYPEIAAAAQALMRRKIFLRSMDDNLAFDGAADSETDQAARDALIAYAAAAAASKKAAQRAALTHRKMIETPPEEIWKGQSGRLQFGVVAAQMATFGLAVFLLSFILPTSQRRDIPSETFEARQARAASLARLPPARLVKETDAAPIRQMDSAPPARAALPAPPRPLDEAAALGLSQDEQRRAYSAVADWRSTRIKNPAFKTDVGAVLPGSARLGTFPRQLVAQTPKLRGYRFVLVERRVAVVDPATRRIVAFLAPG